MASSSKILWLRRKKAVVDDCFMITLLITYIQPTSCEGFIHYIDKALPCWWVRAFVRPFVLATLSSVLFANDRARYAGPSDDVYLLSLVTN